MTNQKQFVTKEGLEKLLEELDELKNVKRKEISERISEAKEHGDLSENAEYIEAKDEQAFAESRIIELEEIVKNSEIISHKKNSSCVQIGSTVKCENQDGKFTYTIVGSSEADPSKSLISNESPIGKSFLDKCINDEVAVKTPNGEIVYKIVNIE